jgi:hypothetical protein
MKIESLLFAITTLFSMLMSSMLLDFPCSRRLFISKQNPGAIKMTMIRIQNAILIFCLII